MQQHKIDFGRWNNFSKGAKVIPYSARTEIVLAEPGSVTVYKGDGSYIVGYGTRFVLDGSLDYFKATSAGSVTRATAEVIDGSRDAPFTNINKLPTHSAETQAVMLALRAFNRERAELQKMREEISRQDQINRGHRPPDPEPEPEPEPEAEPEPVPEPDPEPAPGARD
jgi:hypothetical protein